MAKCSACKAETEDGQYCSECGEPLRFICQKCGTPGTGKFCGSCGEAIGSSSSAGVTTDQAVQSQPPKMEGIAVTRICRECDDPLLIDLEEGAAIKGIYHGDINGANQPHGCGKADYADGAAYEGEWQNGLRHGAGRMVWRPQSKKCYTGTWVADRMCGTGQLLDGTLEGGFSHDLSFSYEGEMRDDEPAGLGRIKMPRGEYTGTFSSGFPSSPGVITFTDGKRKEVAVGEDAHVLLAFDSSKPASPLVEGLLKQTFGAQYRKPDP